MRRSSTTTACSWNRPVRPLPSSVRVFAPPVNRLIGELAKLPGIGQRTAQRLAFHILGVPDEEAPPFADVIDDDREQVGQCEVALNLAVEVTCRSCQYGRREDALI